MRILIAEDETSLARAIAAILKKNGYDVEAVHNGEAALECLCTGNYGCAILDLMMPRLDGLSVLKRYRASGGVIPILILSAKSEVSDKVLGLDSGANDYLTKPFATQELLARIRAITRSPSAFNATLLRLGNITLNRSSFELSSSEGSFHLTNKEFQILEMLMSNPRQLIPTDRLMEKVWGYDNDAEINVVWVYISYLRKKLASLNATIQIRVTRGVGYTLEEKP